LIRVVAALALLLAACGDDTTVASLDLSAYCSSSPTCCPGARCSPIGSSCGFFESQCTCDSDGTWHCHPSGPPHSTDLSTPTD
jgi:hypothetical protein